MFTVNQNAEIVACIISHQGVNSFFKAQPPVISTFKYINIENELYSPLTLF